MMIGLGTDIQSVPEFERARALHEPGLIFTELEYHYGLKSSSSLTGLFSAKEALLKALPLHPLCSWTELEVRHDHQGAPHFHLHGELAEWMRLRCWRTMLSISHSAAYATATVLIVKES